MWMHMKDSWGNESAKVAEGWYKYLQTNHKTKYQEHV